MARFYFRAAILTVTIATAAFAFQAPVTIIPRANPAPAPVDLPRSHLRIDSSLVLIPVHVTTPEGVSVTNLKPENFQLFEDGVEQNMTVFTKDDAPVSIGLLFDTSGSMHNKMKKSSEAAAAFFRTANAEDEFFLIEFSEKPKLAVPFTSDSGALYKQIVHTRPTGRTSLLDAVQMALVQMRHAHNQRKAIVIVSDGGDNRSRHTATEIKNAMLESDVQLYAMGIFDTQDPHNKLTPEEQSGPRLLDELAAQSGGRHFRVDDLNDLPAISARIGNELRNQYVLGYSPANAARDGKYRRVKLNLKTPEELPRLRTYYRQGYYAPAQ